MVETTHHMDGVIEKSHENVNTIDFKGINKSFHNNKRKRPTLNTQEKSI